MKPRGPNGAVATDMGRVRSVLARHDLSALALLRTRSLSRVASLTQCVSCPILIVRCLLSVSCGCAGVPTNETDLTMRCSALLTLWTTSVGVDSTALPRE